MDERTITILLVLLVHWIADFVVQTDNMAINKSSSNKWLLLHVGAYTAVMCVFGPIYAIVNGASHLIIDWFTSRATSALWKKGDRHSFFVVIGLDQLLHTVILIATISLI